MGSNVGYYGRQVFKWNNLAFGNGSKRNNTNKQHTFSSSATVLASVIVCALNDFSMACAKEEL